ncbi:MAG: hypothetical protein A3A28_05575 [Candidatus Sungbacteria bacterium RIFCSPLOWO2_01_FULL_47_32]|uniref:Uncharacterized protein n=1 Tax=Candidatus Sungbacteria bacterium RIFCSPHIGHO2_01_FULL_47_32 TaxID=1802264 RepID=A0A1G2K4U2_9BACT|nr:MAG: hypothetical protein A2633_04110 [Candidatus Sungbacteria bacterium RIFCSPHIGHO2_01_FULL_47_32]OGZ98024.1 MAG: hypothetical protein A3D57_02815 [Candidatus Sungbacteria bacterium RIFCSPHIGHO2_02_FULL_46_12]OHA05774.1 MAG: hypothetical protein A3A28_05575 [Candidatus Sungbacteria bacterium RIFCSPLOWO2_01_FULL_47_32]
MRGARVSGFFPIKISGKGKQLFISRRTRNGVRSRFYKDFLACSVHSLAGLASRRAFWRENKKTVSKKERFIF